VLRDLAFHNAIIVLYNTNNIYSGKNHINHAKDIARIKTLLVVTQSYFRSLIHKSYITHILHVFKKAEHLPIGHTK
jgi:hypothetical protein